MAITSDDLEFLSLRIFGKLNVPVGGSLKLERLQQEWRKTRLRRGDLTQGLQLLVVRNAVHKTDNGYQLTQEGFNRAVTIRRQTIRSMLARMRIMTKLTLMRSGVAAGRRQRDSNDAYQRS